MPSKIQGSDVKTVSDLTGQGGTAADLPRDTQLYVTAYSSNKTLNQAITDGDIRRKRQWYTLNQAQNAMLDRAAQVRFDLGTANIVNQGDAVITASDDSGSTRTRFTANMDCIINYRWKATQTAAGNLQIRYFTSGGTLIADLQSDTQTVAGENVVTSGPIKLSSGEFLCFHSAGGDLANTADITYLEMYALQW